MAEKVFISYSHQDGAVAHGIARYLARHDCEVWIDAQNLRIGEQWADNIETALTQADTVVAILSSSSLRRLEVLKEIRFALKRMAEEGSDKFQVFFVVIGRIHPSWFRNDDSVSQIKNYLAKFQYIELSAYGEVTIEAMKELLNAIKRKQIEENTKVVVEESGNNFIYQNSQPEKAFDNYGDNIYYKVFPADLAPSAVYPFAMDNQWLPEVFYDKSTKLYADFAKEGFLSAEVQKYLYRFKEKNFLLSLFHYKQVIIKLNTFIFEPYFTKLLQSPDQDNEAFRKLLSNGSIIVLLNNEQMTPFIRPGQQLPDNESCKAWNELCSETEVYCIRENWASDGDLHARDFLRFCSNMAMDHDNNVLLAQAMCLDEKEINAFLVTLKTISMQTFCQTHMNGTRAQDKVDDYSRTLFYQNYIVRKRDGEADPVYACLFDSNKPFHHELKRLIDIYYNSLFCNSLQCDPLLPADIRPENYYLHSLYLQAGEKEVSIEELQYAFSEFFYNCEILDEITALGDNLYLEKWDLEKISELRSREAWYEYVELLELINRRSNLWRVDFNEVELLLQRFLNCFDKAEKEAAKSDVAFSFRVMVGSKVLDIVKTTKIAKVKEYGGSFADPSRIPLKVFFCIGDLSKEERNELIFLPVILFNGRIDTSNGDGFFNALKEFIVKQCDFILLDQ